MSATPGCSACGNALAKELCSGCKVAVYCGKDCQRKDWKTHKPQCAALKQSRPEKVAEAQNTVGLQSEKHEREEMEGGDARERVGGKTMFQLVNCNKMTEALTRCDLLTSDQAFVELTERGELGNTALHWAMIHDASMPLVATMCDKVNVAQLKLNLFAIANDDGVLPFHYCASSTTKLDVLEFAVNQFPYVLTRRNGNGDTPLDLAYLINSDRSNFAAVARLLEEKSRSWPNLLNQSVTKCCLVELKRQGMTAFVADTPINALTPPQFVFKVCDEFVNREMRLLANEILSYVGTNIGLEKKKKVGKATKKVKVGGA